MKLTVLGSGVLIPVPQRGNSGYFLQTEKHSILIDGGAGALRKLADFQLDYRRIDTICYTHLHPDHTLDLVPLLFAFRHDPEVALPRRLRLVAPRGFRTYFKRVMEIYGQWVLRSELELDIQEVVQDRVVLEDLELSSHPTLHSEHSVAYRFTDAAGKTLFYSGDSDYCDSLVEGAREVDVLLLECSFPDDLKTTGHLTPSECGRIAARAKPGRLILTHFYPQILETDILTPVARYYSGPVDLASDGLEVLLGG